MAVHNQLGIEGENIAVRYLAKKGFEILHTNWRFEKKEIDIIAKKDNLVIIAEVKTRSTGYFGEPAEAVTRTKQRFLIDAADVYLEQLDFDAEVRFDIISIIKTGDNYSVRHIEDAFVALPE